LALGLIWLPGPYPLERLYLASAFAVIVYAAFFVAFFAMPLYGGRAYDDNGYLPFTLRLAGKPRLFDVNFSAFSVFVIVLIGAMVLLTRVAAAA
jgi:hypothetical protein